MMSMAVVVASSIVAVVCLDKRQFSYRHLRLFLMLLLLMLLMLLFMVVALAKRCSCFSLKNVFDFVLHCCSCLLLWLLISPVTLVLLFVLFAAKIQPTAQWCIQGDVNKSKHCGCGSTGPPPPPARPRQKNKTKANPVHFKKTRKMMPTKSNHANRIESSQAKPSQA